MAPRIIFMGTPDFSVAALNSLHKAGYSIPFVITQPDKPKGRGRKLEPTPVKKAALELGIKVIQPESINTNEVIAEIEKTNPDFFVVVAFGQFLSENLLLMPRFAPINIHASLLPAYRGSAPIHRAILNGETTTGVTTMFMDKGMDTGDILDTIEISISEKETAETLHDKLAEKGAELIITTIEKFLSNNVTRQPQNPKLATTAPMLKKKEGLITWSKTAAELDHFVRGMTPWPGAYTFLNEKRLKIFSLIKKEGNSDALPGTILPAQSGELIVATGNGIVAVTELQGASGKKMAASDFLRGSKIKPGDRFQ